MAAVVLVGSSALRVGAQSAPANKCEMAGILCAKDGACEGKCAEVCAQAGKMLTAVRTSLAQRMKAQFGEACPCTSGQCSAEGCGGCEFIKSMVFAPLLREKVASRLSNAPITFTHVVRGSDGKLSESPCTFKTTGACENCEHELADAAWAKGNELLFQPIGAFIQAVQERVVSQVKADGSFTCACLKGECKPGECATCKDVKATVFEPMLKQRVQERLANLQKDFTHTVRIDGGAAKTVPCTFLRGGPCPYCADEFAAAVRTKLTEVASAKR